jgi:hypothetical protein
MAKNTKNTRTYWTAEDQKILDGMRADLLANLEEARERGDQDEVADIEFMLEEHDNS